MDYLSPEQVCEMLPGITKSTLAQWRYMGAGPRYRKLGKSVVYVRQEVVDWVESSARSSTAEVA
jgi:predicted DNA-binding transcriptional regulator AlpA